MILVLINMSKLPKLPKKSRQVERTLDSKVANKLREKHGFRNWLLEVKTHKGKLAPHQKVSLKQVENGKFLYKFPDGFTKTPADYVFLGDADAIVCVIAENERDVHCEVNGGVMEYDFRL